MFAKQLLLLIELVLQLVYENKRKTTHAFLNPHFVLRYECICVATWMNILDE